MTRKQKKSLARILAAAVLLLLVSIIDRLGVFANWQAMLLPQTDLPLVSLPFFLVPYLTVGLPILRKAVLNMAHGQIFDENFLMTIATLGAFAIGFLPNGQTEYAEAVFVMLFYQVGELFQSIAVGKSRRSIAELMNIRPDTAHVWRAGVLMTVAPEQIAVGEIIEICPGERIALDGTVIEGTSTLDTAALTGEAMPRTACPGDAVISGCINQTGILQVRAEKPYAEATVTKILHLVETASAKKARSENFISRFARIYTPAVVAGAVLLAVLPPLLDGTFDFAPWVFRALEFLVISCPCALVISVPLSFFGGIGAAARRGILIKGSCYMEALANCTCAVFDKTGTLTEGAFSVREVRPTPNITEKQLLLTAAAAEYGSTHPIALSLCRALPQDAVLPRATDLTTHAGHGVSATVDGKQTLVGNAALLSTHGIVCPEQDDTATVIYVAQEDKYLGCILIADAPKPDAADAIAKLKAYGMHTVMLTGDRQAVAEATASQLHIDCVQADLLPADKVNALETVIAEGHRAVFVGDGINDAPVLSRADVGVAMGALGSDAALEAADIVLMNDTPSSLPTAIRICRRTRRIVRQNIVFSLFVKFATLALCAIFGIPMTLAVFADVGVLILAVLNAVRALRCK